MPVASTSATNVAIGGSTAAGCTAASTVTGAGTTGVDAVTGAGTTGVDGVAGVAVVVTDGAGAEVVGVVVARRRRPRHGARRCPGQEWARGPHRRGTMEVDGQEGRDRQGGCDADGDESDRSTSEKRAGGRSGGAGHGTAG